MKKPTAGVGPFRQSYVRGGGFRQQVPRLVGTFETAVQLVDDADPRALALCAWKGRISAALIAPLHVCEIVMRNAVSDAIEQVYGPRWPRRPLLV
jgi:hypothetical protein